LWDLGISRRHGDALVAPPAAGIVAVLSNYQPSSSPLTWLELACDPMTEDRHKLDVYGT
jgi:hypothetical protein